MTNEIEAASRETTPERLREMALQSDKIDVIIAANSKTPQDILKKLAKSDNNEIRKALTTNANTPPEILLKLGKDFPKELLANPVFNLMLLANPNLLRDMPKETLISIIELQNVRESFLIWALNHCKETDVLMAIIFNHVQVWNKWREENSEIQIHVNLNDLRGADLSGANLRKTFLGSADLSGTDLSGADLSDTYLKRADLSGANLSGVKLDKNTQIDEKWLIYR